MFFEPFERMHSNDRTLKGVPKDSQRGFNTDFDLNSKLQICYTENFGSLEL